MKAFKLVINDNSKVKVLFIPIFYSIKQMNRCLSIVCHLTIEDNELFVKYIQKEEKQKIPIGNKMVYSYVSNVDYFLFKTNDVTLKVELQGIKDIYGTKPFITGISKTRNMAFPLSFEKENQTLSALNYRPNKTITKSYEKRLVHVIKDFIDTSYLYYSGEDAIFKLQFEDTNEFIYIIIRKDSDENGHIDFFFNDNNMFSYLNSLAVSSDSKGIFFEKLSIDLVDSYNKADTECIQTFIDDYKIQIYKSTPGMSDYLINNTQATVMIRALEALIVGLDCLMQTGEQGSMDGLIQFVFDEEGVLYSFNQQLLNEEKFFNQFLLSDYQLISQYIDFNKTTEFYQVDIVSYEDNKKERIGRRKRKGKIIVANDEICVIRDVLDYSLKSLFNQVVSTLLDTIIINGVPEIIQVNNLNTLAFISDLCTLLKSEEELSFNLEYIEEAYLYEYENNSLNTSQELKSSIEEIKDLLDNIEEDDISDKKLVH